MFTRLAKAALQRLPLNFKYEVFYQFSRVLGVEAFVARGNQGPFLGATGDRAIMRTYLLERAWSMDIVEPLQQALAQGGTFLDVGANVGLVSLSVARLPGVQVVALEPDEENFAYLSANAALQGRSNVRCLKQAAWSEARVLQFAQNPYNAGDHHIASSGGRAVQAVALDSLDLGSGPLVVKIDTQGAEPEVMKGGMQTLQRAALVIVEFWPWGMQRMGLDPADAVRSVLALGGSVRAIHHGQFGPPLNASELAALLDDEVRQLTEYRSIDLMISCPATR